MKGRVRGEQQKYSTWKSTYDRQVFPALLSSKQPSSPDGQEQNQPPKAHISLPALWDQSASNSDRIARAQTTAFSSTRVGSCIASPLSQCGLPITLKQGRQANAPSFAITSSQSNVPCGGGAGFSRIACCASTAQSAANLDSVITQVALGALP